MTSSNDFTEDEIAAAVEDVLQRSHYEDAEVGDVKKAMSLVLSNSINVLSCSVLHNVSLKELEALVAAARQFMSRTRARALSKNLPELNEEEDIPPPSTSKPMRKTKKVGVREQQDSGDEEATPQLPSPNKFDLSSSFTNRRNSSSGRGGRKILVPEYWKSYPLVIEGAIRDALSTSKIEEPKLERMFRALREIIMSDASIKSVKDNYQLVFTTIQGYYHKTRERLVNVLGEMAVPADSKQFLLTAETSYTSLRNHLAKYRGTSEQDDTPTTSRKGARRSTTSILPTSSPKPTPFALPALPPKRDSSGKRPGRPSKEMTPLPPPPVAAPTPLRSKQHSMFSLSDRDPEAAKKRDIMRWLQTSTFSVHPTTPKENRQQQQQEEEEVEQVKGRTVSASRKRASAGDAVLNASVSKNTRSKSSGDKLVDGKWTDRSFSSNIFGPRPAVGGSLAAATAKKSPMNSTYLGLRIGNSLKQQVANQVVACTPPAPTTAAKLSPGSSGGKKTMLPSHWTLYPQVVEGAVEMAMDNCKDHSLRTRTRDGVLQVVKDGVFIAEAAKRCNVSASTMRRYFNLARDALVEVLGAADTGLPAHLQPYVHSSTTYQQLEKLIQNGPPNEGAEQEEIETLGVVATRSSRQLPISTTWKMRKGTAGAELTSASTVPTSTKLQQPAEASKALVPQEGLLVGESVRKRRHFSGTVAQLREVLTKVLKKRFTGNLEKMVEALTETIIKDQTLALSLKRKEISLEYLLAAYNFVGRFLALERLVVREDDEEPALEEQKDSAQLALPVPPNLNRTDKLCLNLVNAFGSTKDTYLQRTCLVKYVVGVSYKGDPEQKIRLRKCVHAMLVDNVSANCACEDYPTRRSYALDYLERCKEARRFLCTNFPKLAEAVLKDKVRTVIIDEEDDEEEQEVHTPRKKRKMMDDIGDATSSVPDYLDDNGLVALLTFSKQLKEMGFPIIKNLVVWLTKYMLNAKEPDLLEHFEWTQPMEEWLEQEKIVTQDLD